MRPPFSPSAVARLAIFLAVFIETGGGLSADPPDAERHVVAVNVIDESGGNVRGLTPSSFRGSCHGEPVQIIVAELDVSPRLIALVLDASASMAIGGSFELALSAAEDMVETFAPVHRLVFYEFRERLERRSSLTNDRHVLRRALAEARKRGSYGAPSALYNAVVLATRDLRAEGFADVLYFITDGEDTGSLTTDDESIVAAARSGMRVFVNRPPSRSRARRPAGPKAEKWIARIVEATGGLALGPGPAPDDRRPAESILPLIAEVYRLEIVIPRRVKKPREWTLEVVDAQGETRKDVRLVYPRLIMASRGSR